MVIREYDPLTDKDALQQCIVELQNYERKFDPRMRHGEEIVGDYIDNMLDQCRKYDGRILVIEHEREFAGYLTLLRHVPTEDIDDGDYIYALVSDIAVLTSFKGLGLGKALMAEAIRDARQSNVRWLRLKVLSQNRIAKSLYEKSGFKDLYSEMEMDLDQGQS